MSEVMSELLKRVESGEIRVPSLPTVASKIIELTSDENISNKKIADVIEKSQTIVVNLLKIANSIFYRGAKEVKTVQGAITRVGLDLVKNTILNISLLDVFKGGQDSSKMQKKVWEESFTMAVCARSLARRTDHRNPEEAFTIGLVAHVGMMIILTVVGKDYLELLREKFYRSKNLNILEREAYQTDHVEVGYLVLSRWNFPEIIKETVKHHDSEQILSSPNERLVELIKIIQVAEKIAFFFVSENPLLNEDITRSCKLFFDSNENEVEEFLRHIQEEVNEAASLLGIDRIIDKSYEEIQRSAIGKLADLNLRYDELNKNLRRLEEERKRGEQEKIQLEKLGALGTLTAGIAHEMNNPMMGMLNFGQYCLKHTSKDNRIYPVLEDLNRETERCIAIVQNLLTFSRIEKEDEEKYKKEGLSTVFDRVFNLLSFRIEKENILLTQQFSKDTPDTWLKVSNIQQALLNIIGNSLDALKDSKEKKIRVWIRPEGKFVLVIIADSGCGIPPENLHNIFDPFFTTKPTGQGTGLGLSVCHSIIKAHGGEITCKSEVGVGTKFIILLPIDRRA